MSKRNPAASREASGACRRSSRSQRPPVRLLRAPGGCPNLGPSGWEDRRQPTGQSVHGRAGNESGHSTRRRYRTRRIAASSKASRDTCEAAGRAYRGARPVSRDRAEDRSRRRRGRPDRRGRVDRSRLRRAPAWAAAARELRPTRGSSARALRGRLEHARRRSRATSPAALGVFQNARERFARLQTQLFGAARGDERVAQLIGQKNERRTARHADQNGRDFFRSFFQQGEQPLMRRRHRQWTEVETAGDRDAEHARRVGRNFDAAKRARVAELGVACDPAKASFSNGKNADAPRDGTHTDDQAIDHLVSCGRRLHGCKHACDVREGRRWSSGRERAARSGGRDGAIPAGNLDFLLGVPFRSGFREGGQRGSTRDARGAERLDGPPALVARAVDGGRLDDVAYSEHFDARIADRAAHEWNGTIARHLTGGRGSCVGRRHRLAQNDGRRELPLFDAVERVLDGGKRAAQHSNLTLHVIGELFHDVGVEGVYRGNVERAGPRIAADRNRQKPATEIARQIVDDRRKRNDAAEHRKGGPRQLLFESAFGHVPELEQRANERHAGAEVALKCGLDPWSPSRPRRDETTPEFDGHLATLPPANGGSRATQGRLGN